MQILTIFTSNSIQILIQKKAHRIFISAAEHALNSSHIGDHLYNVSIEVKKSHIVDLAMYDYIKNLYIKNTYEFGSRYKPCHALICL